ADILGSMYEKYIGRIQSHRKEQGIYYTPGYIVDYIVRNTLGEVLKGLKKPEDADKIKVLDMACGSGSFLLKAFEVFDEYYAKKQGRVAQAKLGSSDEDINIKKKAQILQNSIFGVDLDAKAVEIAQLNLLLKTAETRHRLPLLKDNIQHGNSLIDDEKVAPGTAFKWEERFAGIMNEGGFDVIIGNPPYVRPHKIDERTKRYLWKHSKVVKAKGDLYAAFIERGIDLLKEKGEISLIVPHTWLSLESFEDLRSYINQKCKITSITIAPKKVFQDATVETLIFVFERCSSEEARKRNSVELLSIDENSKISKLGIKKQAVLDKEGIFDLSTGPSEKLVKKIDTSSTKLKDRVDFFYGLKTADDDKFLTFAPKNGTEYKKLLRRSDFGRYYVKFKDEYVFYKPELMRKNKNTARPGEPQRFEEPKIVIMDIAKKLVCTFDDQGYYIKDALLLKNKDSHILKYLVALINSKVLNYYYLQKYKVLSVAKNAFLELPIKSDNTQDKVVALVDKLLSLNKQLQSFGDKQTSERQRLEDEIKRADAEIDRLVYDIYGLTEGERNIVEASMK
ncbi:MAG: N-6 DNA methylase, partial [archaeon]